jgi:hypothetical protein
MTNANVTPEKPGENTGTSMGSLPLDVVELPGPRPVILLPTPVQKVSGLVLGPFVPPCLMPGGSRLHPDGIERGRCNSSSRYRYMPI